MSTVVRTVYLVHHHVEAIRNTIAPVIEEVKAGLPAGIMEFPPKTELHLSLGQWRVEEGMISEAKLCIAKILRGTEPVILKPSTLQHLVVCMPRRKDKVYTQARILILYEPVAAFDQLRYALDRSLKEIAVPRRRPYVSSQPHNTIGFGLNRHIGAPLLPPLPDTFRAVPVVVDECDLEVLVRRGRGNIPLETVRYPFKR